MNFENDRIRFRDLRSVARLIATVLMVAALGFHFIAPQGVAAAGTGHPQQDDANRTPDSTVPESPPPLTLPASDDLPARALSRFGEYGQSTAQNGFYRVTYSPNLKYMAARDRDQVIHIFDVENRKKITEINWYEELGCYIVHLVFSPDSRYLVSSTESNRPEEQTRAWDVHNGELVCTIASEAAESYFSADGKQLIVLGSENVEKFAFPSGEPISKVKWKAADENAMAMSRDGRLVVCSQRITARPHFKVTVRDLENKSAVNPPGALATPRHAAISPDNLWLVVYYQGETKIWLTDLRQPQNNFVLLGHKEPILSLCFSPDNRFLVSTSRDRKVIVWDLLTRMEIGEFVGHSENVVASTISEIGFRVATGSNGLTDSSIIEWDLAGLIFAEDRPEFNSFEIAWNELGSSFPRQSLNATRAIVDQERWLDLLRQKLVAFNMEISQDKIKQWINDLGSPKYAVRQAATDQLLASRGPAELLLRQALEKSTLAEVKSRITLILRQPAKRPKIRIEDLRRLRRAIFALELTGTSRAEQILELIATSNPNIDLARDAADSLKRLQGRPNVD